MSARDLWEAKLEEWRDEETLPQRVSAAIMVLARVPFLDLIVSCWANACPAWQAPSADPPADSRLAWRIAWGERRAWADAVSAATGLPAREVRTIMEAAIANRLIFPDATISQGARTWLTAQAAKELRPPRPKIIPVREQ